MTDSNHAIENALKIAWPIVILGGFIGFFLSWLVLSGDQQGRVNLFYLLLVYLLIPLLSISASLVSLIFGRGINLARLISSIPLWTFQTKNLIRKIQQLDLDKSWFLMQSQAAAIAFSLASLATYFILLLATDLNFVWRSTILNPVDIYPFLELIAMPWRFWGAAQPGLELLEMTRDSRMAMANGSFTDYGAWWQFILATQLFYSLFLRVLLILWSRTWIKISMNRDIERELQQQIKNQKPNKIENTILSDVVNTFPGPLPVSNWDGIPASIIEQLPEVSLSGNNLLLDGWQDREQQVHKAEGWDGEQLLIVKAWEPPMGELEDFMKNARGYLLPLDWHGNTLKQLELNHFHEWQRFINQLGNWQLYIPQELVPE